MDINIKKIENGNRFEDARPKIREISVPISLSKALSYWSAASRWALILFAGLAPIFFLPFTNLPVAANKEILVFGLILISFFALLGRILIEGRVRYPGHLLTIALSALVFVWGASAFFSLNPLTSLIGGFATPDSFFAVLLFSVLTLSIAMTFNRKDIIASISVFLASLSFLGLFELLQLFKVFVLPFSFAKNSGFNPVGSINDVGVLLAFGLVIASGLMSSLEMPKILKRFLIIAIAIFVLNLAVMNFWAIWVGLALAMVFMISFLSMGLSKPDFENSSDLENTPGLQLAYFQKAWLPSIILLVSLLFIFIPSPFSKFIEPPVEVSPSFNSTLNIGISNLKSGRYLLGSGPNTFSYIFNLYKSAGVNQTIFWSTAFNSGAEAMASWVGTVGILGILALLFLIVSFIWVGVTSAAVRNSSRGILNVTSQSIFVAVCFLFSMWFLYTANFTVMAFAFWGAGLFLAASLLFAKEQSENGRGVFKEFRIFTSPPKTFLFSLLIVGLMVLSVVGIYFESNRYIAEAYFSKTDYASAIKFWQYDERYFQNLSQSVFLKLSDLLAKKDLPQETVKTEFQNITTNAISAARQAQALNPQNPLNSVLLGNIYENLIPFISDAANFALSAYGGAVSLDPKNPSNYLSLARVEIAQADMAVKQNASNEVIGGYLDKAVFNLEESIKLKDDYAPSRFLLVQVYDRQGKLIEAIKKAEELVMMNNTDVGALFQLGFLYYKNGQFDQSKPVFERVIELSPNYSNARYFLGLIFDRESQQYKPSSAEALAIRVKAIEQFEKIAELNPDNGEIKQILANLAAKKPALSGIAPPAPQNRGEAPVPEGVKKPLQKINK